MLRENYEVLRSVIGINTMYGANPYPHNRARVARKRNLNGQIKCIDTIKTAIKIKGSYESPVCQVKEKENSTNLNR